MGGSECCRKCGSATYGPSKKRLARDGFYYCVRCADQIDGKYRRENTCFACSRPLKKWEAKFAVPSRSKAVSQVTLPKRVICGSCYDRIANRNKMKAQVHADAQEEMCNGIVPKQ